MAIKIFLSLLVGCMCFINGDEAATATCEFGPMDGVEGKRYRFEL